MRRVVIGLTGSIGMGKSTTAALFAEHGLPVWDADAAVHRLYATGGAGVEPIRALCPEAIVDGAVSRPRLAAWIAADPEALARIEAVVHPLVAADRAAFIATAPPGPVVLDIPLLFETGADARVDIVAVVSTDPARQRERVLSRPGMTAERFDAILARQLPDAQKRARADVVIPTDDMATARAAVAEVVARARKEAGDA
ncbi:dephospho-CoA kinase [Palleronia sediminis]|uniref:Dephospho-CoA kinase n=1 Tax=Palleronia sediminis TaxID=2547833 RepID=A0A4R6AAN3_9RHOB|nr:dephospho-CoA kinase [Palleronia sediminis]TDL78326.1 dephospho-CoA kinase [Palleronia sediminis]